TRASRTRHARDLRQEPELSAADLAALFAAGSQGVRSRACPSVWPRLPDRGLLAALCGRRDQSFDPQSRTDPDGIALAGGARIECDPRAVAAVLHAGGRDAGRWMSH